MAKLIQKSGFLSKKRAGRYMKYIATRDGVEILDEDAEGIYMRYIATIRVQRSMKGMVSLVQSYTSIWKKRCRS